MIRAEATVLTIVVVCVMVVIGMGGGVCGGELEKEGEVYVVTSAKDLIPLVLPHSLVVLEFYAPYVHRMVGVVVGVGGGGGGGGGGEGGEGGEGGVEECVDESGRECG